MALKNQTQTINVSAQSVVGDITICYFTATIESGNPDNVGFGRNVTNSVAYRTNHTECTADQTAFEDTVYSIVDRLKTKSVTETTASASASTSTTES